MSRRTLSVITSKMQCVKLRSVMGSYLNIHLNLFPIYVLLLLLTLSHGRPSAKVRETREQQQLHKSHRQFRDKWYQLSNISPSNINSVSHEYSSVVYKNIEPISQNLRDADDDQQVSSIINPADAEEKQHQFDSKEEKEGESKGRATGSHRDDDDDDGTTTEHNTNPVAAVEKAAEQGFPTLVIHTPPAPQSFSATAITMAAPNGSIAEGEGNGHSWDDHDQANLDEDDSIIVIPMDHHGHPSNIEKRATFSGKSGKKVRVEKASNSVVEDNLVETEDGGSQQQLGHYRQNILRSLGHFEGNGLEEMIPANVSLSNSHMDTLTKYNISKEEYLQAYTEYMGNVKKRRLANRDIIGVKDRRRNAVTISKTYHDNGTDLFSIGSKVLKLFRFDIQYTPTMEGADVRILRVVLNLPAMCQLTGHLSNSTDLPDLRELAALATAHDGDVDENDTEQGEATLVDLTRNVTSWSVRSRTSSPFIVMAICSRDVDSLESPIPSQTQPLQQQQQHHRRHASHHGSSLKVVTKEFMKPTYNSQIKRRSRRATASEPSTLRSFNHKRDMGRGRECANTRHGKTCCRRSLKIKFSDLGISDVILEPQEFDAHVCDGRCNARRVAYASTHAMFQHILHQTKGKKFAPRPCCVPTALSELDVLHVDPNGNRNGGPKLIVTILKDAIVKECGCS